MKKLLILLYAAVTALSIVACEQIPLVFNVSVQVRFEGASFPQEGITVTMTDAAGAVNYTSTTNADGLASFLLPSGSYTASALWKTAADGVRSVYNGSTTGIVVAKDGEKDFTVALSRVESQQLVIKELYFGGCNNPETNKGYTDDAYVVLYNNSDVEADAGDIVFSFLAPYNGHGSNKYYTDDRLLYENDSWIPAYGAIWWFTSEVKIPAYSQVVVAIFGAIDHTQTVSTSVNLGNSAYYWMSNSDVPAYTNKKYAVADAVPASHYLTCVPISQGNAWAMSNSSPGFYIGRMDSAEAKALSENADAFDHTLGTAAAFNVAKFPKSKVVDAIEVWSAPNVAKSQVRFSADINTGHVDVTNNQGYSVYRNVDKEATEALPENAGKLVYNYAGGTDDIEGSTDPSGIDAEASIAAGAHIIYADTNDSGKDFHQRKVASLKK